MLPLVDSLGRTIDYLRVSVTDRCNLRCRYCMPPEGVPGIPHDEILRYEEIARIVRAAAAMGVAKVRLTGGEPLVRRGIVSLVSLLREIPGIRELAMTTNATLLDRLAEPLAAAGLDRVNVSLDTLDPAQYAEITRGGSLAEALRGIEAAEAAGLGPIKVNAVVARGINEGALVDLARLTLERPWSVRFIEWMPLNGDAAQAARLVPSAEVRAMIERSLGPLRPAVPEAARSGRGPAVGYRLDGARGTIGLISPVTQHFCAACNRLRLTADGRLRLCLLADDEVDLRALVRAGAGDEEIQHALRRAVACKPAGHRLASHIVPDGRHMAEIGG
jgi:cyclic pyranopterin phosphate synthase